MKQTRTLDPSLKTWLHGYNLHLENLLAKGFKQTPTNAREGLAILTSSMVTDRPEISWVQDDLVDGEQFKVPIRIYHPAPDTARPLLIYFHGGGGMAGSITVYDAICRKLAVTSNHIVISVDYRLAPECPYPCGVEDGISVVKNIWDVLKNRGLRYRQQLSMGGDSGGGALCATVTHTLQHAREVDITKQLLIYPGLDYTLEHQSMEENGTGYLLHKEKIEWFYENYFQSGENRRKVSPLHMEFSPALPESMVVTAEFCPLRDEGYRYVEKLKSSGVTTYHLHFDDMIHAFINLESLVKEQCNRFYKKAGEFLNGHKELTL